MPFNCELLSALSAFGMSLTIIVLFIVARRKSYQVRFIDSFVLLAALTLLIYSIVDSEDIDFANVCKGVTFLLVYMFVRLLPRSAHKWLYRMVIAAGIIESITASLQLGGILGSNHPQFQITGHLQNPGPLGGFITLCLLVTIWQTILCIMEKHKIQKVIFFIIIVLLQLTTLILTESRAAYIAFCVGLFTFIPVKESYRNYKHRFVAANLATLACLMFLFVYFYNIKHASANGRLFIWTVCAEMICESPIIGHGIGSFPRTYMLSQGEYIKKNAEIMSFDSATATDNIYAFNEPLHLIVEMGIVGVLLIGFLVLTLAMSKKSVSCSLLLAWITFSCFSYPLEVLPLLLAFPVFFAMLPSKVIAKTNISQIMKFSGVTVLAGICFFSINVYSVYAKLQNWNVDCLQMLHKYPWLRNNEHFSMAYMLPLCNKSTDIKDYRELKHIIPSVVTYNALGKYLIRVHDYKEAEMVLLKAAWMAPRHVMAKYTLWKLYVHNGRKSDAVSMANSILQTKVKVTNSFTINVIHNIKKYLSDVEEI